MLPLVVFLPAPRAPAAPLDWVQGSVQGQALGPAGLPPASERVAVLPPESLSWHRLPCPRAPAARLAQALAGLLEDALLDETEDMHLALEPGARAGQPAWVAATARAPLAETLARFDAAGRPIARLVPALAPAPSPRLWLNRPGGPDADLAVHQASPQGCWTLPAGPAARALLPEALEGLRLDASPEAAAAAEAWLGRPVHVLDRRQQAREALESPWNLRQFGLAARHPGLQGLQAACRVLCTAPAWRPLRWGLLALAGVQVLGLQALAWSTRQDLQARRDTLATLLREADPEVPLVREPLRQLQQLHAARRQQAGESGPQDLEALLARVAAAWPEGLGVQTLQFDAQGLSLAWAEGGPDPRPALQGLDPGPGWRLSLRPGRLELRPEGLAP